MLEHYDITNMKIKRLVSITIRTILNLGKPDKEDY